MRSISRTGLRWRPKRFWARRKIPLRIVSCLLRVRAAVVSDARHASIAGAVMSSNNSGPKSGTRTRVTVWR